MRLPSHPDPIDPGQGDRIPFLFVLRELADAGNEDAGLVLWQMLRHLRARLDARHRPGEQLLNENGGKLLDVIPELRTTLRGMDRMLRERVPGADTWEGLVLGCAHVGLWAEGQGACGTAVAFFQVAEEIEPERPHLGYHIGRLARKLACYPEAEAWLRWAHDLARAHRQWEVAALCMSGLGNLYRQKGNLPLARNQHEECLAIAERFGLRTLEGDAYYDLAGISFDMGLPVDASGFVRAALTAYGPGHGRIPRLARDVAWVWMDKEGRFADAAALFLELVDHIWEPWPRLLLFGSLTRAAAGAGWLEVYERAWNETWAIMRQQPVRERHADALVQLALGATMLRHWDRARVAAGEALTVARSRREGENILIAEAILGALSADERVEERLAAMLEEREVDRKSTEEQDKELGIELAGALRNRRDDAPVELVASRSVAQLLTDQLPEPPQPPATSDTLSLSA